MEFRRFAARRALIGVAQIVFLLAVVFGLSLLMPGDAADVQSSDLTSAAQREETREVLGLDVAPLERFMRWCAHVLTGDLGTSYATGQPVSSVLAEPFLVSAVLALLTTILLVPVGFGAG